jgi:hypothetical protein
MREPRDPLLKVVLLGGTESTCHSFELELVIRLWVQLSPTPSTAKVHSGVCKG